MSGVVLRCVRIPRRLLTPGISLHCGGADNSSNARNRRFISVHAARPAGPKRIDKGPHWFRKKNLTVRSKHPYRKKDSAAQESNRDHGNRAYSYNVPAMYRRQHEDRDDKLPVKSADQAASEDQHRKLLQKECHALLLDYQRQLFPVDLSNTDTNSTSSSHGFEIDTITIHLLVGDLTSKSQQNQKTALQNLRNTEEQFKNICFKLQKLTQTAATRGTACSLEAEASLRSLIQLRTHRASMVGQATKVPMESNEMGSWGKWIANVFILADVDDADGSMLTAHLDTNFGPNLSLFGMVLESISNEASQKLESTPTGDHKQECSQIQAAERMTRLVELMPSSGFEASSQILCQVLNVYRNVASFLAACKAEKFYNTHCKAILSWHPARATLGVYQAALETEGSPNIHAQIAMMASTLVNKTDIKSGESFSQRVNTFSCALRCLQFSTATGIPGGQCSLADAMIKKCVGRKYYRSFFHLDQAHPEPKFATLINNLLSVYVMSRDEARVEQAKALLTYLEATAERLGSNDPRHEHPPLLDTYVAILMGIEQILCAQGIISKRKIDWVMYALSLLDRIVAQGLWPDNKCFALLFRISARLDAPDAGEEMERILRRMKLREVFDSNLYVTAQHYNETIHAWGVSANHSFLGAAERAGQLLKTMEIQSGVSSGYVFTEDTIHEDTVRGGFPVLYNQRIIPDASTYSAFLQTCSMVIENNEKDRTLAMVFDTLDRMEAFGIEPNDDVFKHALLSCKNLCMDPARQVLEAGKVFDFAQKKAKVSRELVKIFREMSDSQKKAIGNKNLLFDMYEHNGDLPVLSPPILFDKSHISKELPLLPPMT